MNGLTHKMVDDVAKDWRQGDCILGEHKILVGFCPRLILNKNISVDLDSVNQGFLYYEEEVLGFVILSQTCDIVRLCENKPFIEIAPLCSSPKDKYGLIKKGWMPTYTHIPTLADKMIVSDLDRTMTVEKTLLVLWNENKTRGCRTDEELRFFARAITRKKDRFAFSDDFTEMMRPFVKRVKDRHAKNTNEGGLLRSFADIRIRAAPDWVSNDVTLTFWFITEERNFPNDDSNSHLEKWRGLIENKNTRFKEIDFFVTDYHSMTAQDYLKSDPLDLDMLSVAR